MNSGPSCPQRNKDSRQYLRRYRQGVASFIEGRASADGEDDQRTRSAWKSAQKAFGEGRITQKGIGWLWLVGLLGSTVSANAQAPASTTTLFDGTYAGVSREYSWIAKYGSAPTSASPPTPGNDAKCGQNGVPFPLTITNGVVQSTPDYWEGTVSPQGALVMRTPHSSRADGWIDNQGIIRARRSGTDCVTTWVWRKQSR